MNANTTTFAYLPAFARPSRAQFSPITRRFAGRPVASSSRGEDRPNVATAARDFAQRAFLSRWARPALLDRAEPVLTHYRD